MNESKLISLSEQYVHVSVLVNSREKDGECYWRGEKRSRSEQDLIKEQERVRASLCARGGVQRVGSECSSEWLELGGITGFG